MNSTIFPFRPSHPSLHRMAGPVFAALALAAVRADATDGRYRDFVIGERAGGMGGAAVAVASDVDAVTVARETGCRSVQLHTGGMCHLAGLANSAGDSLSLSANLYGRQHYRMKGGLDWGEDEKSDSIVTIPGAMGGVSRLSDEWVAGFGAFAPKQEKRHLVAADGARRNFSHGDYTDQTLWIGPAVSWMPVGSRVSVGAGVFAVYRDCSISQSAFQSGGYSMNAATDFQTLGLLASAGVQIDLRDGWRAGVTIQTPTVRVWDDGKLSINGVLDDDRDLDVGIYSSDVRADNCIPWQVAFGIGRTVPDKWGFALDAIYHPSHSFDLMRWNVDGIGLSESMHLHSVLDVSLGGEYIVAERYPIRAGVYTAFSAIRVPDDPENTDFITSDIDMYGVTFSVGRRSDNMCVNLGVDCAFGSGHDRTYGANGDQVRADCDRREVLAMVSTTYYF